MCYDKLPYSLGSILWMRKIQEKSKAFAVKKKREEKESMSEILIIAPFTQDSAVVCY